MYAPRVPRGLIAFLTATFCVAGKATHKEESLKVMGDVASGTGSYVAQSYLKEIMETFFSPSAAVRLTALSVVTTILRQGLIHPVQTVPYLIAMQTDSDASTRVKAEAQLQEIESKFPGFIHVIEGNKKSLKKVKTNLTEGSF